jgi:diguanylate cyclase (GGDEF)-like protein
VEINVRESRDGGQVVSFKGSHEEASGLSVHPALPTPAQAMFELGRRASSGMPFAELAEYAVGQIAQQFGVPCVALMEVKDGTLVPAATYGWPRVLRAALNDAERPGAGFSVTFAQASVAGVEPDAALSSELMVRGRAWGVLAVHGPAGYAPRSDDTFRLAVVAHFLSAAKERELANQDLEYFSRHDPLTGLANKALLLEHVGSAVEDARANGRSVVLVYLGVDNFTIVNESLGHTLGDALLADLAIRLSQAVRAGDMPARDAGDRFVVLCHGFSSEAAAGAEAGRLRRALSGQFRLGDHTVGVTVSAGFALSQPESTADELLRDADLAMYRAKEQGRSQMAVVEATLQERRVRRLDIETELRRALGDGELIVYYQPVVELERRDLIGTEGLVRWVHPTRGFILPGEFIPVAEDSKLIIPIGEWVLNTACRDARSWAAQAVRSGVASPGVAVNLSARQINEPELVRRVSAALDSSGLAPDLLTLEITESVVMTDAAGAGTVLRRLKDLGVRLSIDDFGTGYSSLSYLKRFPVDTLKIDRSFVDGLGVDPDDSVIVGAIVRLADALGLQTIAEGVETTVQAEELLRLGCPCGQGFLFARPGPSDAIRARLEAEPGE